MSYISYIGGKYIETTGGDSLIYARENIVTNSQGPIEITSGEGIFFGEPEIYESNETLKGVKVTASIFFDGTKNNRNNTFRRLDKNTKSDTSEKSKTVYSETKEADSSYENGYSNVAILEMMNISNKKDRIVSKYIEGEGTEDDQEGSTAGYGFGGGKTGIPAKVNKGFNLINAEINGVFKSDTEYVRELTVNVFGFSRGAAAARSFMTTTKGKFKTNYPKARIKYKFIGLFDTVSSYEPTNDNPLSIGASILSHNFKNDVAELGLQLNGMAEKVIHLTAADEYRENFCLTTIDSDIAAGVGYELKLPGAHSDIGGGYQDYPHIEQRYINRDGSPSKKEYLEGGWYTEDQLKGQNSDDDPVNFIGKRQLKNSYQFIPLSIMMTFAKKYGMSFRSFEEDGLKGYKVIADLESAKEELEGFALQNEGAVSIEATIQSKAVLKKVRNKYLHISTNAYSTGMGANYEKAKVHRYIIHDNA
jgi:hypothetical protein